MIVYVYTSLYTEDCTVIIVGIVLNVKYLVEISTVNAPKISVDILNIGAEILNFCSAIKT